jgi:site-specific recombinase XerD
MSTLAPTLQAFFTDRLATQRRASDKTVAAYRDTWRLLLRFAAARTSKPASSLDFADLDADLVGTFLNHLEHDRHNSARTRNARLAAIRSLFRYAALHHPEHAASIQRVLSIPPKRFDRALVTFLSQAETQALLDSPDGTTWIGRRDHAILLLAVQTGVRVAELTALARGDVALGIGAHIRIMGKGRKERCTPLASHTAGTLRDWLREHPGAPTDPLFPNHHGTRLSTDAVQRLVAKHATTASQHCPSLASKSVTPHVLRHTSAMRLREAGVDIYLIALWLGHEHITSTQMYLHADLAAKERALARTAAPSVPPGRYQPPDALLAFLDGL